MAPTAGTPASVNGAAGDVTPVMCSVWLPWLEKMASAVILAPMAVPSKLMALGATVSSGVALSPSPFSPTV